ncbi:hypothetical protein DSL64_26955 [Dyadobacter luteus]|uniref:DNA-binding response regulator n=1 Tax=Dyadobacter luteus TaxID=2259619 RepID=A0A3D8Y346_9BACT|nr:LytTR family DNA-binding domain-containing protein [Dyadobacter luteus]REA56437.1 hypothetical protein DSL64_26955 [Dyadobacter luteus]
MNSSFPDVLLRSLIIDDQISVHNQIKQHIAKIEFMDLPQSCINPIRAPQMITSLKPHIIFLDIEMPDISGIELLDVLGPISAAIIIVTAHKQHAWQGYQYHVQDFLDKPIQFRELFKAVNKVRLSYLAKAMPIESSIAPLAVMPVATAPERRPMEENPTVVNGLRARFEKTKMMIKVEKDVVFIKYSDLYMIRSEGNYLKLFTKAGTYVIRRKLKQVLESLPYDFIQTHRSYIVNSESVVRSYGNTILFSEISDNAKISKRFKHKVYRKLGQIHG